MIEKVKFQNFKALRDVEVSLERLTVIVGPNSSGKSSILQGLNFLSQACRQRSEPYFKRERHPIHLHSRGSSGDLEISCQATEGNVRLRMIRPADSPEAPIHLTTPAPDTDWKILVLGEPAGEADGAMRAIEGLPGLAKAVQSTTLLRLELARMAAPSYSELPIPRMGCDGEGLASVLAYMALTRPDDFQQLQAAIRKVLPAVQRIRFERVPIIRTEREPLLNRDSGIREMHREFMGDALLLDLVGAPSLPAHLASEGTILVLGMLTILMGMDRPRLVLLDDIDHALHPRAQKEFIGTIRTLLEQHPDLQIVATTHSPYLLDCLRPEEVRITALDDAGTVACSSLQDHPAFERWKEEMTPGEFWSTVGEKWVVGEHAAAGG